MPTLAASEVERTLLRANRQIRAGRTPHPSDTDWAVRKGTVWLRRPSAVVDFYQFWFRTRGCTFDRGGQCSMCNYGVGPEIDPDAVYRSVAARIASVPEGSLIYLSPSGSLFDEREVPAGLRRNLLRSVARRRPVGFTFETRPEFCSPRLLDEVQSFLPGAAVACHLGVESWDPDKRRRCHLKRTPTACYETAARELRARRIAPIANITLGGLGLSPAEAYEDTLATIRGTRAARFAIQMLFPLSAKQGSLLGWAHEQGLWEPPSLWLLIRALWTATVEAYAADEAGDLSLSWYNPQVGEVVTARPDSCPVCRPMLIDTLKAFALTPSADSLGEAARWDRCGCRSRAERDLTEDQGGYQERLEAIAARWTEMSGQPPRFTGDTGTARG
ncbi:hypothetical protein ACFRR7_05875 [Streptomyces sp. NPDC056909]|uniref:hypothetical protein n=1 Tax=Streptomyces sp. NPDC056909 TaxID=3345963 RepID=UPI0036CB9052